MADEVILRQSDLQSRLILDYETTNELGWLDDLLVDVKQAQVVGILAKESMWQRPALHRRKIQRLWNFQRKFQR